MNDDIVRSVEDFDEILMQVLDNHSLTVKEKSDPHIPICPFRDAARPYCRYKGSLSEAKDCEDYCRLQFRNCPTYQEHRLSKLEREFIEKVVEECLICGVDFDRAKRQLQRCFVTKELVNKKKGGNYGQIRESNTKNPVYPIRCRVIDRGNSGGLVRSDSCHSG